MTDDDAQLRGVLDRSVRGKCIACGRQGLFLGSGGYVTCSHLDCPDPSAPADLLEGRINWQWVRVSPNDDGTFYAPNGWTIRRTYTVGRPGEVIERLT